MARNFDGLSGDVNCGSGASLDNLGARTISAWIKPTSMGEGSNGALVSKVSMPNGWSFRFHSATVNAMSFVHTGADFFERRMANNTINVTGVWQHILMTWTGVGTTGTVKFYKNGTETSYGIEDTSTGGFTDDNTYSLLIGNVSDGSRTWAGDIAELAIWNAVINANEITALSRGVSPIRVRPGSSLKGYWPLWGATTPEPDYSGNQNNGTVTGAAVAAHAPNIAPPFGFDSDWRGAFTAAAAAGHPAMRRHGMIHYGRPFTSNFRKVA